MIHSDSNKIVFDKTKEVVLEAKVHYVNMPLMYYLAYTSFDSDGLEYPYNLFELARDPTIIDKIANL